MKTGWVDSHCHLDFETFNQDELIPQLTAAGCEAVLVPATQARFFQRVLTLKQRFPDLVKIAFGLHPYFIKEHSEEDLIQLDALISQSRPHAMGEFGLDFLLEESTFDSQNNLFNQQLSIANQHKLPLVIHCRKAHDQLAHAIKQSGFQYGGFIHAFSGSLQQAKRYQDLGFVLGLGGALTYSRAQAMHKMVAALSDTAYTLETDSPDMPPEFARGEINTPLNVPKIAQFIAHLRGQTIEQVVQHSTHNFRRVLAIGAT